MQCYVCDRYSSSLEVTEGYEGEYICSDCYWNDDDYEEYDEIERGWQ